MDRCKTINTYLTGTWGRIGKMKQHVDILRETIEEIQKDHREAMHAHASTFKNKFNIEIQEMEPSNKRSKAS
jgi:hypothetical protein